MKNILKIRNKLSKKLRKEAKTYHKLFYLETFLKLIRVDNLLFARAKNDKH